MIPKCYKSYRPFPMYFVDGESVTETEFRRYLRRQGMSHHEIERYFKAARAAVWDDDD